MTDLTFKDLWLSESILAEIEAKWYTTPSLIQSQVIPVALSTDKDIIWQAQTGSGKTAAFWLPILDRIDRNSSHLEAIILTPTRELAIQVAQEIQSFTQNSKVNIVLLYGWQNIRTEMSMLRNNPQIVVWTPGRVKDHLSKERLDLSHIKYFVLDEADEMLNVWFKEEIEEILEYSPKTKKTFLFSATMPPFIMNLVKKYLKDYELVSVKKENLTNDNITQMYYEVPRWHKFDVLSRIIDITTDFYGIIFCRTKLETDEVASKLTFKWYKAEAIHWDIEQNMREKVLARFKSKKINILVATDVAARWIDVNDLSHVVNFELPDNPETYTHRIWRTGRAGKSWTAISLVSSADVRKLFSIERTIKAKINKATLPSAKDIIAFKETWLMNNLKQIIEEKSSWNYNSLAKKLLEITDSEALISALLYNFYKEEFSEETYRDLQSEERSFRDRPDRWDRDNRSEREPRRDDGMMRLFVAKWKLDWFTNPWNLLAFIGKETWLWDMWAWKVDIFPSFSYIDFPEDIASIILKIFKEKNDFKPLIVKAKQKSLEWWSSRREWGYNRDRWNSSSGGYRWWNNRREWGYNRDRWNSSGWGYRWNNRRDR